MHFEAVVVMATRDVVENVVETLGVVEGAAGVVEGALGVAEGAAGDVDGAAGVVPGVRFSYLYGWYRQR